jgi:hypothetical protein
MNGGPGIEKGCLLVFFVIGARTAIVNVLTVLETQYLEPNRTILLFTPFIYYGIPSRATQGIDNERSHLLVNGRWPNHDGGQIQSFAFIYLSIARLGPSPPISFEAIIISAFSRLSRASSQCPPK